MDTSTIKMKKSPLIVLERENDYGNYIESIEQSRVGIDDIDTMSYPKTKIHREDSATIRI